MVERADLAFGAERLHADVRLAAVREPIVVAEVAVEIVLPGAQVSDEGLYGNALSG